MYSRPEQILEKYDLEVKSISRGRECYLCDTNQGLKALIEYRGSVERATFLDGMLTFLKEHQIITEQFVKAKEGELIIEDEDGSKVALIDAFVGAECDVKNRDNILTATKKLSSLHNIANEYREKVPEFVKNPADAMLLLYEKHNRELRQVRNYIRNKKSKNAFEEMFMKQQEMFLEKGNHIVTLLQEQQEENVPIGFCHGDFNQHNILITRQGIAVVGMLHFSYDMQVSDLAKFMRKMLEKNSWNIGLGMDMIQAYDSVKKIEKKELQYLYFFLAYPEKFWKIANHYNNSHKAWLSGRSIEKLEKVTEQEKEREQFLEILFHFTK